MTFILKTHRKEETSHHRNCHGNGGNGMPQMPLSRCSEEEVLGWSLCKKIKPFVFLGFGHFGRDAIGSSRTLEMP